MNFYKSVEHTKCVIRQNVFARKMINTLNNYSAYFIKNHLIDSNPISKKNVEKYCIVK